MKTKGARNYTDEELELLYTLRVEKGQDYGEVAKQFEILSKFKKGIHQRTDTALERKSRDLNWHEQDNGDNGSSTGFLDKVKRFFRRSVS